MMLLPVLPHSLSSAPSKHWIWGNAAPPRDGYADGFIVKVVAVPYGQPYLNARSYNSLVLWVPRLGRVLATS